MVSTTPSSPPTKRPRTDAATNNGAGKSDEKILDPIATHVLEKTDDWASAYRQAVPYPHGIIPDFCRDGFLGELLFVLFRRIVE
jgi:hypothetical protein